MPKSPSSRTSKKKKYNARFPPARIKKIMQTDEEVGKVAAAVPVIISRALELFIESLIKETSKTTVNKNAKTLSTSHIKQTIENKKEFFFLRDLVSTLPDHQSEDNGDAITNDGEYSGKKGRKKPRKQAGLKEGQSKGESSKASFSSDDDEEEEEEDDDEDTETDEENSQAAAATLLTPPASCLPHPPSAARLSQSSSAHSVHLGFKESSENSLNLQTNLSQPSHLVAPPNAHQMSHHHQQQQYLTSNLPSFCSPPYPSFAPSSVHSLGGYPSPLYPPTMPFLQNQFQVSQHQHPDAPHLSSEGKGHAQPLSKQLPGQQQQPINFAYSPWSVTTAQKEADYDT